MLDTNPSPSLQRAHGRARLVLGQSRAANTGRARIEALEQAGSARVFLPRIHTDRPEAVFLNTSGGLTGGDRLEYLLDLGAGSHAVGTTQTAERAYASSGPEARMQVDLRLGAGAVLDWLPQETIVFQDSALARQTWVDMADDAELVLAEMIVIGRLAMGEDVTRLALRDRREIRRGGKLALVEPLRPDGAALRPRAALTGGARAFATVMLVAPGAEDALDPVRAVLDAEGVEAAASAWDGKCVVRLLAAQGHVLKPVLVAALSVLRRGRALPRVWQV